MIYLVSDGRRLKIGYTADLYARSRNVSWGCGHQVKLITAIEGSQADERQLHKLFASHCLGGEWYPMLTEIIAYFFSQAQPRHNYADQYEVCQARLTSEQKGWVQMQAVKLGVTQSKVIGIMIDAAMGEA